MSVNSRLKRKATKITSQNESIVEPQNSRVKLC